MTKPANDTKIEVRGRTIHIAQLSHIDVLSLVWKFGKPDNPDYDESASVESFTKLVLQIEEYMRDHGDVLLFKEFLTGSLMAISDISLAPSIRIAVSNALVRITEYWCDGDKRRLSSHPMTAHLRLAVALIDMMQRNHQLQKVSGSFEFVYYSASDPRAIAEQEVIKDMLRLSSVILGYVMPLYEHDRLGREVILTKLDDVNDS